MKICKKCNSEFKLYVKIDGINRNLKGRKYCLDCSPFGLHNTQKIHIHKDPTTKKCPKCNLTKLLCEFGNRRGKIGNSGYCKECMKVSIHNMHSKQREFKERCVVYKGSECQYCGYKKCIGALEFHHIDPKQKDFSISKRKLCRDFEEIKTELDKCLLLCANCHREEHHKMRQLKKLAFSAGLEPATSKVEAWDSNSY